MNTINNNYLQKFHRLDKDIKEKTKELKSMKDDISIFLNDRAGKQFITAKFMAFFENQKRTSYPNIPAEVKEEYKVVKEYDILKVQEKV